jgi:diaminohydroxyphosphoribosylaminopyrimidine deaminase/5-amino-6-(5-phosphoribosylamino)uracil reductase
MTPPCADALIEAGVARAVIAVEDPDPRVSGRGIERLRAGGVPVDTPLLAAEAAALNAGFFLRMRQRRPLFTLKLASSLDGRIATAKGESRWITGADARAIGHRLRASHDAVLVGSGTALADDAELTCRLPGLAHHSPVRIVLDRRLRLSSDCRLATTATHHPVWVFTRPEADAGRRARLTGAGVVVTALAMPADDAAAARIIARHLADLGLTRVLIEGGAVVAAAFLAAELIDEIWLMQAPSLLGGDGIAALAPFGLGELAAAPRFQRIASQPAGADWIAVYRRRT